MCVMIVIIINIMIIMIIIIISSSSSSSSLCVYPQARVSRSALAVLMKSQCPWHDCSDGL